jgi:hypothetical protein
MSDYERIKPGHAAYRLVTALRDVGRFACDSDDHNEGDGCSNPTCFKHVSRPVVRVRSVLGDTRVASVNAGGGYPWFDCPFCFYAVYVGEPHADGRNPASINGVCHNPWCLANPAMPLDAARLARGEAFLRDMEAERRQRDHDAAMERIADEHAARAAAAVERLRECQKRGVCVTCANATGKFIKHRGECPRRRWNR